MAELAAPKMADDELLRMTTEVVAAYVSNNTLATGQLGDVIHAVYNSLRGLDGQVAEPPTEPLKPAVPVRKSITPEYLVCLEDGKKLKMLKRHLRSTYRHDARTNTGRNGAWRRITRWSRRTTPSSAPTSPRRSASAAAPAAARGARRNSELIARRPVLSPRIDRPGSSTVLNQSATPDWLSRPRKYSNRRSSAPAIGRRGRP